MIVVNESSLNNSIISIALKQFADSTIHNETAFNLMLIIMSNISYGIKRSASMGLKDYYYYYSP